MAKGHILAIGRIVPPIVLAFALAACGRGGPDGSHQQIEAQRTTILQDIAANPRAADLQIALARTSVALGDGLGAETAIRRAIELGATGQRLRPLLARAAAMQGEGERALAILGDGPIDPDMAGDAAHIAANIYLDLGQLDAARTEFDRAIRDIPKDPTLWVDVARFRNANADAAGARDAVDYSLELDRGNSAALAFKANLVRTQEGLAASLRWYDAALVGDPDNVTALFDQAATLGDMGRYRSMLAAIRRAATIAPKDPRLYYLQAVLAARADNYQLARSLLQRARGELDEQPSFLLLNAIVELELGGAAIAADHAEKLLLIQPNNLTARHVLALANWVDGDGDGAADALAPLVARRDADSWSLILAARVAAERGKTDDAAQYLRRAALLSPDEAEPFAEDDSYGLLSRAADASPLDPSAVIPAIRAEMALGQTQSAQARAEQLRDANRGVVEAQLLMGDAALANGDFPLAIRAYRDARAIDAGERPALRLAFALLRAGDPAGSAAAIRALNSSEPSSLAGERLAGHLAMDMGHWDAAIASFDLVRRRIGNRDAVVIEQLARAWLEKGNPKRALPFASYAYRLQPMNIAVIRLYADLLQGRGDGQAAQDLRDKAAALTLS